MSAGPSPVDNSSYVHDNYVRGSLMCASPAINENQEVTESRHICLAYQRMQFSANQIEGIEPFPFDFDSGSHIE